MYISESAVFDLCPVLPTRCPTLAETESLLFLKKKKGKKRAFPLHLFHLSPGIIPVLIVWVAAGLTVWHGNQGQRVGPGARLISDHKRCLVNSSPDDGAASGETTARDSCRVSSTSWIRTISSFTIFPVSISIVWPLCVCVCVFWYMCIWRTFDEKTHNTRRTFCTVHARA